MRHGHLPIGQSTEIHKTTQVGKSSNNQDVVLEKSIFNNIFEKDIRRVFIYKKAERLAKAIHLIAPAFIESVSLRNRIDAIAIGLVDAATLSSSAARTALSRELLALSSILSMARTGGTLSPMNADLIAREAHTLLQEIASYEEPRILFDETPTLSDIAKKVPRYENRQGNDRVQSAEQKSPKIHKGHIKDITGAKVELIKDRREAILSVIRTKKRVTIKDISTLIRNISEKTIQRELLILIALGIVVRQGERRWSTYSLA